MDSTRTTTRDIRRHNRSVLLSKLFFDGPLSRLELSQQTGLSSATVSTVTAELIEDQLIIEAGQVDSGGGRPRVLLRVDPAYGVVVGVDVGETGVNVELFDLAMAKLSGVVRSLDSVRPSADAVVAEIVAGIDEALDAASVPPASIIGIGIGVPGIVEQGDQLLVHAPTIDWKAVPLLEMLGALGVVAPMLVGNGAQTQAQAEMWFGAARGARHAIVALVGSGVGAAIISDGAPYQGVSSSAGEWGHTTLVHGGRSCRCGARGCLEAYVGAESILEQYSEASSGADEASALAALIEAAGAGNETAAALARRHRRLPRCRHRQPDQPVQPGAGGPRRLGRPGARRRMPWRRSGRRPRLRLWRSPTARSPSSSANSVPTRSPSVPRPCRWPRCSTAVRIPAASRSW